MAPVKSILAASMLVAAQLVSGHAVITNAVGDAGGSGMALGVVTSTPRDGTRRNPFQQDATRFRGASADTFGETVGQGANNLESGMSNIMAETGDALPQVTPGGKLTMTLHQVNSDGAGPYQCMINADGTGTTWENIQVSQNVEGNQRGRNRQGSASDHPLVADIPANQQCTGTAGGQTGVCLVRCQNPANAGPFGGVVPVQMAAAAAPAAGGVAATPAAGGVAATPAAGGVAATPAVGGVGATPATGAGAVPAAGAGAVPAAGANTPATGAGAGVSTPATGAAPATGAGAVPAAGAGAVPAAGAGAVPAAGANTPATGAGRNGAGRNGAGRNGAGNAADDDDEEEEEETGNTRGNGRNRNNNRRAVAWNA